MTDIATPVKSTCTKDMKTAKEHISYVQPLTNISKIDDTVMLEIAMPGIAKENIDLRTEKGRLIIKGMLSDRQEGIKTHKKEFGRQNYKRSFHLPQDIDQDMITAQYQDGILTVQLPKKEEAKRKTISIH